jgi:hypothetical protein
MNTSLSEIYDVVARAGNVDRKKFVSINEMANRASFAQQHIKDKIMKVLQESKHF